MCRAERQSDYCDCCGFDGESRIVEDKEGSLYGNARTAGTATRIRCMSHAGPAAISGPSSGTRDGRRRSVTGYCICDCNKKMYRQVPMILQDHGYPTPKGEKINIWKMYTTAPTRYLAIQSP